MSKDRQPLRWANGPQYNLGKARRCQCGLISVDAEVVCLASSYRRHGAQSTATWRALFFPVTLAYYQRVYEYVMTDHPDADLPAPPAGKVGWPWEPVPARVTRTTAPPRVSIVVPSYNQGRFIEAALCSILNQDYPNFEMIVVDGASTDETRDIIKRYAPWIDWWVSEPDDGQSDAINKGFERASGIIGNWLCSDDILLPGALWAVAAAWKRNPRAVAWLGHGKDIDVEGADLQDIDIPLREPENLGAWLPRETGTICQPFCFFDLATYRAVGGLRKDLHYVMDVHLWVRLLKRGTIERVDHAIAGNRNYPDTKTNRDPLARESEHMAMLCAEGRSDLALRRLSRLLPVWLDELVASGYEDRVVRAGLDRVRSLKLVQELGRRVRTWMGLGAK